MAVLKSEDGKDLIVTCRCGCDEGLHIRIERDCPAGNIDSENDTYCYATCLNSNWYRDQGKKLKYVIWDKLINSKKSGQLSAIKIFIIQKFV